MTITAPDKEKRSHGPMWYVAWGVALYLASWCMAGTAIGVLDPPRYVYNAYYWFYEPINCVMRAIVGVPA